MGEEGRTWITKSVTVITRVLREEAGGTVRALAGRMVLAERAATGGWSSIGVEVLARSSSAEGCARDPTRVLRFFDESSTTVRKLPHCVAGRESKASRANRDG